MLPRMTIELMECYGSPTTIKNVIQIWHAPWHVVVVFINSDDVIERRTIDLSRGSEYVVTVEGT